MFTHDPALSAHLQALQSPPRQAARPARRQKTAGTFRGTIASVNQAGFAFLRPDIVHDGLGRDDDIYIARGRVPRNAMKGARVSYNLRPARKPGHVEAVDVQLAA